MAKVEPFLWSVTLNLDKVPVWVRQQVSGATDTSSPRALTFLLKQEKSREISAVAEGNQAIQLYTIEKV